MKTPEELNTLKEEFISLQKKLSELTDEELSLVTGGERYLPGYKPYIPETKPIKPEQNLDL
ncbi:MAG: bacteriocin [Eubacteriales bacterium]|nr:bacteriocin [Eubacteriales bacterium]